MPFGEGRTLSKVARDREKDYTSNRLRKLAWKWVELLGETERKMENGYHVKRIIKQGEIGEQVGAFRYMFKQLAYGDRSRFGEKDLEEFKNYAGLLIKLLQSIKKYAEKKVYQLEEAGSRNFWQRFETWLQKVLIKRPYTIGWYDDLKDTAGRTLVEIENAIEIIAEKFENQLQP